VLATTLLVTTLLTVMLAASFLLVSAEQRTTDNSFGAARSLALAQAGLQSYFSLNRALADTASYDSARIVLARGYADVVALRVRPLGASTGSAQALFVVRSTGVATSAVMAGQVQSARTIVQYAQLNPSHLPARAAMVALNGVSISGGGFHATHPLSGHDLGSIAPCVSPGGAAADTFSISTPGALYHVSANVAAPAGEGTETWFPSWSALYDSTHVDWPSIVAGNLIPDVTIPVGAPQSSPPWPVVGANIYNVSYVPGNVTIPTSQRRGVLVAAGDVTVSNGTHWDGIILAGGRLIVPNGTGFVIHGMIVTGLNIAIYGPGSVPQNVIDPGTVDIQWTWCYTQSSINSLSSLVPIRNAWADSWTTY